MHSRTHIVIALAAIMAFSSTELLGAQLKRHSARISVTGDLEKDRDSSKNKSGKSSSRTKSEMQYYELEATVANTGKTEETYTLEWFFFKRKLNNKGNEGDPELASKNKTTLTVGPMKRVKQEIVSDAVSWEETTTTKNSSGNNNKSNSSSKKKISGDVYDGYLIVLRAEDGTVITLKANEKKFEKDEWLGKLGLPVN